MLSGVCSSAFLLRELRNQTLNLIQIRGTVIVERWWQVSLAAEGKEPYLHPRRHRIYKLVEDTKHKPKEKMELILTQTVKRLGSRGDTVFVKKALGRNKLLAGGLAVYPSPENKEIFEEEKRLLREGKLGERSQTRTGELTLKYLQSCHLTVGVTSSGEWELTKEIVCRNFLKNLGVFVPPHALTLPEEQITQWGEYWCEVTVNGIDCVRIPMSVVNAESLKAKRQKGEDPVGSEHFHSADS
ncbi:39S ribosomal protein L9, mitochondrial [Rhinatrema bivittatum]|uniref:39S ribosomal protein L9, mitochondrial n=1 Tax=Rhinatrema bivittatum TaxID=194408 RepID=UPI001127C0DC|nr:39S ribosomal protein L9, mitochondrial [Rhinatrema bivittatum]